jgi:opacity protein-like surface antigen
MANAWADFAVSPNVTVHAGGGIGAARVRLGVSSLGGADAITIVPLNDSDTVFAFQLGAGAAWHVMPNVSLTLDYRYFQAVNPSFRVTFGGASTKFSDDYQAHSIMVGVRGKFATGGP